MNIQRIIDLKSTLSDKSCFLFGPRQTGKSWLIRNQYSEARVYNLLEVDTFRTLSRRPQQLREEISAADSLIVIDEIQLLPELLNEVHLLIEKENKKFLLTGSSARKLHRQGVNLLGGRARWKTLHPFVRAELGKEFNLTKALQQGTLPSIYNSKDYFLDLKDYVEIYLREEIASETAIRNLPAYSRFLDTAALCNSQIINYTEIGSDAQISPSTIREYFQILKDTLLIERLPAWKESKKRKAIAKDKFYFFDIGVARFLQGRKDLIRNSDDFGTSLETYLFHELSAYCSYISGEDLSYWRSTSGFEVDFLLSDHTAIEVKATEQVTDKHLKGLLALKEENSFKRYLLVSLDKRPRTVKGCEVVHLEDFLERLWNKEFV
jgi:predicted AAA+ superfamily ATPase